MNREEIERSFVGAGWEVCGSSSPDLLLVGNAGDLSILAYRSLTEDPVFELVDRRRGTTYWVRIVPTPRVAAVLLEEHGEFMESSLVGNRDLPDAHLSGPHSPRA